MFSVGTGYPIASSFGSYIDPNIIKKWSIGNTVFKKATAGKENNCIIDSSEAVSERNVVNEERRIRFVNSSDGVLEETLYSMVYPEHPYGYCLLGLDDNILQPRDGEYLPGKSLTAGSNLSF